MKARKALREQMRWLGSHRRGYPQRIGIANAKPTWRSTAEQCLRSYNESQRSAPLQREWQERVARVLEWPVTGARSSDCSWPAVQKMNGRYHAAHFRGQLLTVSCGVVVRIEQLAAGRQQSTETSCQDSEGPSSQRRKLTSSARHMASPLNRRNWR
jgi:hypothetical protein